MSGRLNPRLTARALAPQGPVTWNEETENASQQPSEASPRDEQGGKDDSSDEGTSTTDSTTASSSGQPVVRKVNPKRHLLHCGKWIPKQVNWLH